MIEQELRLTCRDPVIARDGRPFGVGNRMRALGWPSPGTVAGAFRTALAKSAQREFGAETNEALLQVAVAGTFPVREQELYLPAPTNCVVDDRGRALRAGPEDFRTGEGCDWDAEGLKPVMVSDGDAAEEFKPLATPAFWPLDQYEKWLTGQNVVLSASFLSGPEVEIREHVGIQAGSGAADEGRLFVTAGLHLSRLRPHLTQTGTVEVELATRVSVSDDHWAGPLLSELSFWHPLGGERRLVQWRSVPGAVWTCPEGVRDALHSTRRVSMIVVTPALFDHGWKPGWLDERLEGVPPSGGPRLRLVGVCIQRWRALSGWSVAPLRSTGRPGPKPVRRVVPAGGVYFFGVFRRICGLKTNP